MREKRSGVVFWLATLLFMYEIVFHGVQFAFYRGNCKECRGSAIWLTTAED